MNKAKGITLKWQEIVLNNVVVCYYVFETCVFNEYVFCLGYWYTRWILQILFSIL